MPDDPTKFARLVHRMRELQRQTFTTRDPEAFREAAVAEREVDRAIRRILRPESEALFPRETGDPVA